MTRKVHIETWGCQMNTADAERMLALLAEQDYALAENAESADLVLLNTCHIREKARHKVLSRLGELRVLKEQHPGMRIAVAGCVAQAEGRKLVDAAPQIDVLFGPGKIDELPRLLREQDETKKAAIAIGFKAERDHEGEHEHESPRPMDLPPITGKADISRFVNIQQGCDNFCTFCVVPHTRGREVSRSPSDVLTEARALLAQGAREITLLGQNVNSYGLDLVQLGKLKTTEDGAFADLLRDVAALPGLDRLRFTTSNPQNFTRALANVFRDEPRMGRYLHLAAQSGSDKTLERMKRKCTAAEFLERVAWLREAIPDMALSTDLIVGFPGETDADFEATLALVEAVRFSFSFTFKYSPRKHTPAARYLDQIPEDVKDARLARLNAVQDRITLEENEREAGQTREVLFLYQNKRFPHQFYGRTEHFRLVRADCDRDDVIGKVLPVKIASATKTTLAGALA